MRDRPVARRRCRSEHRQRVAIATAHADTTLRRMLVNPQRLVPLRRWSELARRPAR